MKSWPGCLLFLLLLGCVPEVKSEVQAALCSSVGVVPDDVRLEFSLDPFYRRHVDAGGLPVLSSGEPDDAALLRACRLVYGMLSARPDVHAKLVELRARFVVIGKEEGTADVPEYGFRNEPQEVQASINARARGIGGQASSCGEENLMCLAGDRYAGESICVHEFAHTIREGIHQLDPDFTPRLQAAFEAATASGALEGSYRSENFDEYWAEGVQDWFNANARTDSVGQAGAATVREALRTLDPNLYSLVAEVFPETADWEYCYGPG